MAPACSISAPNFPPRWRTRALEGDSDCGERLRERSGADGVAEVRRSACGVVGRMRRSEWSWLATERVLGGRRSSEMGSMGMATNGPAAEVTCAGRKCVLKSSSYSSADGSFLNQWAGSAAVPSSSNSSRRVLNSSGTLGTRTSTEPAAERRVSVSPFCRSHTLFALSTTRACLYRTSYDLVLLATSFVTHLPPTGLQLSRAWSAVRATNFAGLRLANAALPRLGGGLASEAAEAGEREAGECRSRLTTCTHSSPLGGTGWVFGGTAAEIGGTGGGADSVGLGSEDGGGGGGDGTKDGGGGGGGMGGGIDGGILSCTPASGCTPRVAARASPPPIGCSEGCVLPSDRMGAAAASEPGSRRRAATTCISCTRSGAPARSRSMFAAPPTEVGTTWMMPPGRR